MEDRLREMLDHHDIRTLLAEYCHGCDRHDYLRMADTYHDDSWDDHGNYKLPGKEFAVEAITANLKDANMLMHHLGQSLIRVDGDEAGADTYFIASVSTTEDGKEVINQIAGRYVDRLERLAGKWKIKTRVCVREWSISLPVDRDWLTGHDFVTGKRSGSDPSYPALGIEHRGFPPGVQAPSAS
jgi:hypothetical protein